MGHHFSCGHTVLFDGIVHAQIQKVLSGGSNFDNVFFNLMRGGRIQIPLLAGVLMMAEH